MEKVVQKTFKDTGTKRMIRHVIMSLIGLFFLVNATPVFAAWISYVYVPVAVRILRGEYEPIPPLSGASWYVWTENIIACGAISCADKGYRQGFWVYDKVVNMGIENEAGQRYHVKTGKTYLAPNTCDPWYYGVGICNNTDSWQVKNYVTLIGMDSGGTPVNHTIRLGECHYENLALTWSGPPPNDRLDSGSAVACFEAAGTEVEIGVGFLGWIGVNP